jgi:DNA invertase Pin-like site-specific DNA recombinase/DNA-binding transcriptional regulator YiaG
MTTTASASKVTSAHLSRTAYLYVRQSTLRQVLTNTESAARQYGLRQKAIALGWPIEQIITITIDTDQGQSGASAADREGFQRLVAEVGMGRAGIVLGLEVSRLARNNADWHRLLELCALSRTLICDEDGLYDPSDFNDQLLLGLKGTMSQAELHFIRARLLGGQLSKARRGELQTGLPVGLVYNGAGHVVLDPDTSVQDAIRMVFDLFARTGSARLVLQQFNRDGLLFPVRVLTGAHKGELVWQKLQHWRVLKTLHNPRYAGAFAYGRRQDTISATGKHSSRQRPREEWIALIHDAHPGYITWERYEANQQLLLANARARGAERTAGPAREGTALLQGIVLCGRCGNRMSVRYHTRRGVQVQAELEHRADEADALRRQQVQRAQERADLARRRYLAVDPGNRLVADSLEADWNEALRALHTAQDDYDTATKAAKTALSDECKQRIRALATDFPALWSNKDTPQRERKRMVRLLIEDVTLVKTDQIHLHVRLRGGQTTTSLALPPPPNAWQLRQTGPNTLHELDRLLDEHPDGEAAQLLNTAGYRSEGKPFTARRVLAIRKGNNLPSHADRLRAKGLLTLPEVAERLGVHTATIKAWNHAGLLPSHRANDRNEQLYEPPDPSEPRLSKQQGSPIRKRVHTPSTSGSAV